MTVNISLLAGAGWQFFDNNGVPLVGGLLYTYEAGTTTPAETYTSQAGNVANTNPVVMDAGGRVPTEIWLTEGDLYKFVLKDSEGVTIGTWDNISGGTDGASLLTLIQTFETDLANTSDVSKGDALIGFRQAGASSNLTGSVGRTVHQKLREFVSVKDFGCVGDGVTDDYANMKLAVASATANSFCLFVPPGTYKMNATSAIELDLGKMSMVSDGNVVFDFSGSTAPGQYAIWVYSSLSYPESHYQNTTHCLSGISCVGAGAGKINGLLVYHPTYTNNCQFKIDSCSFYNFNSNMYLEANAWRVSFVNCVFLTGNSSNIVLGTGTNQGESIKFDHCMIADGGDFEISGSGNQVNCYSTSILNTRLWVTGNSNTINLYGGNIENPGSALAYQFIRIGNLDANNHTNTVNLFGVPITINPTTWTDPLFYVLTNNSLNFVNITWPDINNYDVAGTTGYLQYVDGGGKVSVNGSSYWPLGGGAKPIVSKQVNSVYNGDFETGNTDGWTVAAYGTAGSTAVASASAKKDGSYGLLVTTVVGGGVNVSQNFPVRPGELVKIFCWAKVATLGASPAGYFNLSFVSAGGQVLATYGDEITSTDWTQRGTGVTRYAPVGAASVTLTINGQPGGNVIYFDNAALNIA